MNCNLVRPLKHVSQLHKCTRSLSLNVWTRKELHLRVRARAIITNHLRNDHGCLFINFRPFSMPVTSENILIFLRRPIAYHLSSSLVEGLESGIVLPPCQPLLTKQRKGSRARTKPWYSQTSPSKVLKQVHWARFSVAQSIPPTLSSHTPGCYKCTVRCCWPP